MLSITKVEGHPIWHVQSESKFEIAMTFIRMQEFQESPGERFCGKEFSLDEYMDWYARERAGANGQFTYATDWAGFNVGSKAALALYRVFVDHTIWEKRLKELLERESVFTYRPFYLIGTLVGASADFFEHELRHALFGTNTQYKLDVCAVLRHFPVTAFRERLAVDYGADVIDDEVQAYALTGYGDTYGKPETEEMRALSSTLKIIEAKYLPAA